MYEKNVKPFKFPLIDLVCVGGGVCVGVCVCVLDEMDYILITEKKMKLICVCLFHGL